MAASVAASRNSPALMPSRTSTSLFGGRMIPAVIGSSWREVWSSAGIDACSSISNAGTEEMEENDPELWWELEGENTPSISSPAVFRRSEGPISWRGKLL